MTQEAHQLSEEETLAYRSMSTQALIGLTLAVVSPLAFFAPLLLIIPFGAAVLSCAAAVAIARSPESLTGQWAALIGLFLSVTVAAAVYSRDMAKTSLHVADANALSERFFQELAEGDLAAACELTVVHRARQPDGPELEVFYQEDEQAKERLETFVSSSAIKALSEIKPRLKLISESTPTRYKGGRVIFGQVYEVTLDQGAHYLRLDLERTASHNGLAAWRVAKCEFTQPPS